MNLLLSLHFTALGVLFIIILSMTAFSGCVSGGEDESVSLSEDKSDIKEGFIEVPGGKVWYRVVGSDSPGIPLLVLHGGPGAPHDYLECLGELSDERPVIFYDQLGCGNSERPDNQSLWTKERFVGELSVVREKLAPGDLHILGQSWGTMLAVDYMLTKKPEGVVSLVLSAPFLSSGIWIDDQREYVNDMPDTDREAILDGERTGDYSSKAYQDAMMNYYGRHVCLLDEWPDSLKRTFDNMGAEVYNTMWGPSEFTMTGNLKGADLTGRLNETDVPVLFTCGEYDEATPQTTAYYQSLLPGSEMIVFENASHSHHLEKTDEYISAVRDFLKRAEEE